MEGLGGFHVEERGGWNPSVSCGSLITGIAAPHGGEGCELQRELTRFDRRGRMPGGSEGRFGAERPAFLLTGNWTRPFVGAGLQTAPAPRRAGPTQCPRRRPRLAAGPRSLAAGSSVGGRRRRGGGATPITRPPVLRLACKPSRAEPREITPGVASASPYRSACSVPAIPAGPEPPAHGAAARGGGGGRQRAASSAKHTRHPPLGLPTLAASSPDVFPRPKASERCYVDNQPGREKRRAESGENLGRSCDTHLEIHDLQVPTLRAGRGRRHRCPRLPAARLPKLAPPELPGLGGGSARRAGGRRGAPCWVCRVCALGRRSASPLLPRGVLPRCRARH
jgi:hypothetical protein